MIKAASGKSAVSGAAVIGDRAPGRQHPASQEPPADRPVWHAEAATFDKRNPRHLLRRFAAVAAISVLTILLLAGYGVHQVYTNAKIHDAERDAIAVGRAIFLQERRLLSAVDADGRERVAVRREDFATLDARMLNYLPPFGIYKIKVYSRDKMIVYSTDPSIIGKVDRDNARLDRVLRSGEVDSKLQSKDQVADLAGETRFAVDVVETYLPIRADDAIIGSFEVYNDVTAARERVRHMLASSTAVLLAVLAAVFGALYLLMRRAAQWVGEAQEELRELAATDALTGVFNRRYLLTRIEEEYARMARSPQDPVRRCVSFVMVDIDHFKAINDTHGHLAGDQVLREVCTRLKGVLRPYDVIGRYGGEEFLVTLPYTDLESAQEVARRMHEAIRAAPFRVRDTAIQVTVSAGVACSQHGDEDPARTIGRADENLYRAKRDGRDRVCAAPPLVAADTA